MKSKSFGAKFFFFGVKILPLEVVEVILSIFNEFYDPKNNFIKEKCFLTSFLFIIFKKINNNNNNNNNYNNKIFLGILYIYTYYVAELL